MKLYPKRGLVYRWKHQDDKLTYVGIHHDHAHCRGWYQFEKVSEPGKVWCEVREEDLERMEEVVDTVVLVDDYTPNKVKMAALSAFVALGAGLAMASSEGYGFGLGAGQHAPRPQPPKGPRTKPGNSLTKGRAKAKARRKAQQKARRSA